MLTESGAKDVDGYHEGQRLLLPQATARYFERNGWAVLLDEAAP
ncbi:MAG: hypothetical protein ACRDN9_04805 [Streptosporangiaceae bacterium]